MILGINDIEFRLILIKKDFFEYINEVLQHFGLLKVLHDQINFKGGLIFS